MNLPVNGLPPIKKKMDPCHRFGGNLQGNEKWFEGGVYFAWGGSICDEKNDGGDGVSISTMKNGFPVHLLWGLLLVISIH